MRAGRASLILGALALGASIAGIWAAPALALSPSVETLPASSITETTATLNGKVNPNGLETKFYFEYGTTTSYGSKTSEVSAGSGTITLEKSQGISGLKVNTVYHYRIVASNSSGSSQGGDKTFTKSVPPSVETTEGVPDATGEGATLNALVNPNGLSTTYQFEYGTTSGSYSNTVPILAESAGSGFEPVPVSYKITGLTSGTQYYFRVTATNAIGKVDGSEHAFKAASAPVITGVGTEERTSTSAMLGGYLHKSGITTKYQFEYGTTTSYGLVTPETPKEQVSIIAWETASGLSPNTTYHFRLRAENALGTSYSGDETFSTLP